MDDLIGEFITETSESLAVLDLELVKLEQNPNDQNILGNIFRLVHTIKGTCGDNQNLTLHPTHREKSIHAALFGQHIGTGAQGALGSDAGGKDAR
jgi:chemotaxis protein histidine kinase CheA